MTPVERETDESFRERLDAAFANPNMYHREVVPIDPNQVERIRINLWETLALHDDVARRDFWPQNEDACFKFNRACDYWPICKSLDSQIVIDENYRLKMPHGEQAENPHLPIVQ